MATKKTRVMVTLDDDTYALLLKFQEENGYPDRSMALHKLVSVGLDIMLEEEADPTPKIHRRSKTGGDPE